MDLLIAMFQQFLTLLKTMLDAVTRRIDHPQRVLDSGYAELQNSLVAVRQELAQAIATERQLEAKCEKASHLDKELEDEMQSLIKKTKILQLQLSELEDEFQKFHAKKQVLGAQNSAAGGTADDSPISPALLKQVFIVTLILTAICAIAGISSRL